MWQSPPHGSLFFFGQSLANLLTIIGNDGWSRTIISDESDVLKLLEIEVGIGPTFADLQSAAKTTIDNSTMKMWKVGLVTHNLYLDRFVFAEDYFHKWQEHPELNRILGIWSPRHNHIYHAPIEMAVQPRLELGIRRS